MKTLALLECDLMVKQHYAGEVSNILQDCCKEIVIACHCIQAVLLDIKTKIRGI